MVGPLFEEPGAFDRDGLAARLRALAAQNIFIGGSSWKYEGWLGQVYSRERYLSRGRFSQRLFEAECLREYAETFPTVCGDFAFYQFPSEDFWRNLFARTPAGFRFAFKAPEQITCKVFPAHPRYGAQAGKENEMFLDSRAFTEMFLRPLLPHRDKTALIIFEFGPFGRRSFGTPSFSTAWTRSWRAAAGVPLRRGDPQPRVPGAGLLRLPARPRRGARLQRLVEDAGAAAASWRFPIPRRPDFLVCRALLRRGRVVRGRGGGLRALHRDPGPEPGSARFHAHPDRAARAKTSSMLFLFVNNRLEGNAPLTILSLVE